MFVQLQLYSTRITLYMKIVPHAHNIWNVRIIKLRNMKLNFYNEGLKKFVMKYTDWSSNHSSYNNVLKS